MAIAKLGSAGILQQGGVSNIALYKTCLQQGMGTTHFALTGSKPFASYAE